VKPAHASMVRGRTRWRRFALVTVPAVALAGVIVFGMANGAIAASFAVSGSTFKVSADKLVGDGFVQYGGVVSDKAGNLHPVAVSGIKSATLTNLCQSVVAPGGISLVIRAGTQAGNPATASNLVIDMNQLSGDATFTNIDIGVDASSLTKGPDKIVGQPGGFGQQADSVTITGLRQVAWATSAGTFTLNGLDLHISLSGEQCFT
jgi:Family of unknown function (DUF6230)